MQAPQSKLPNNHLASALAFATKLHEGLLPPPVQGSTSEAPQSPENAPQQAQTPQEPQTTTDTTQDDAKFTELENKMETMKTDLQDTMRAEIAKITENITKALNG